MSLVTLPDDNVSGEGTGPHLQVDITSEGSENVYPGLKWVLVDREPEREATRLGTPRRHAGEGQHLPSIDLLGGTTVGELNVG